MVKYLMGESLSLPSFQHLPNWSKARFLLKGSVSENGKGSENPRHTSAFRERFHHCLLLLVCAIFEDILCILLTK